jgi:5-methylcytosine-specific restriction endonuclease McrA
VLRRAENVGISHNAGVFSSNGWVMISVGPSLYRGSKIHKTEYASLLDYQLRHPVAVARVSERTYWLFQNKFFWDNDYLTADQVYALLVTRQQREDQRIERAQAMVAMGESPRPVKRGAIPDDVKQFVWIRDEGMCQHCGGTVGLQFDHIIPVSKGGSSDAANLQILCAPCNQRKSSGLTIR